jgi:hypothetical protein
MAMPIRVPATVLVPGPIRLVLPATNALRAALGAAS